MAISRAKKTEKVQLLAKELETSTTAIIGTFAKLTVAKDFALRKVIREAGGQYRVVKNKLAAVSAQGTKVESALKGLKGVNSVAFTSGDPRKNSLPSSCSSSTPRRSGWQPSSMPRAATWRWSSTRAWKKKSSPQLPQRQSRLLRPQRQSATLRPLRRPAKFQFQFL